MSEPDSRGMLDTSTVILLGRLSDPSTLPIDSVISAITLVELSVGPHVARTAAERAARQAHLQQAESDFDTIPFGPEAARAFGRVAASLRAAGPTPAPRAFDVLSAAAALAENIPIHTCNPDGFEGIEGAEVRAVPHPYRRLLQVDIMRIIGEAKEFRPTCARQLGSRGRHRPRPIVGNSAVVAHERAGLHAIPFH